MPLPAPVRPLSVDDYLDLKRRLIDAGYAYEMDWAENLRPMDNAYDFWVEYAWVVLNSGMKNTVARQIWDRVRPVVEAGGSALQVFRHAGKSRAIDLGWRMRETWFKDYCAQPDDAGRMRWLQTLPYIGKITVFHLAKNYGMNVAKPDRHLARIAGEEGTHALCQRLAGQTGDRVATVDLVIWRAASLGWV